MKKIKDQGRPESLPFLTHIIRDKMANVEDNRKTRCRHLDIVDITESRVFLPLLLRTVMEDEHPVVSSVELNPVGTASMKGKLPVGQDAEPDQADVLIKLVRFFSETIDSGDKEAKKKHKADGPGFLP